jgi:hypothetical protein
MAPAPSTPSAPTPGRTPWPTFEQTTPTDATSQPGTTPKPTEGGNRDVPFPSSARSVLQIRLTTTLMVVATAFMALL